MSKAFFGIRARVDCESCLSGQINRPKLHEVCHDKEKIEEYGQH